jgi:hypothetical protein
MRATPDAGVTQSCQRIPALISSTSLSVLFASCCRERVPMKEDAVPGALFALPGLSWMW